MDAWPRTLASTAVFVAVMALLPPREGSGAEFPARARMPIAADGARAVPAPPAARVGAEVSIASFDYAPASVAIRVGEAVRWVHRDGTAAHNVFGDDGSFRSPIGNAGMVFAHVFPASGRYTYRCSIHPTMTGEVNVLP